LRQEMKYISTRGGGEPVASAVAIKAGLAPDGGLFVPGFLPEIGLAEAAAAAARDYQELAGGILQSFLSDFSAAELEVVVEKAYGDNFDTPEIAPVHLLGEKMGFLELWHGPTCAFKDLALQALPHLLKAAVAKTGDRSEIIILVATSGDTGKAALEGFRDLPGTRVIVFFPDQGVSRIQERQMTTQEGANTFVVAVEGDFDKAQAGVKRLFADGELRTAMHRQGMAFSSANSINWGRLVPQIVYYFWAWFKGRQEGLLPKDEEFNIVVPTGNFGNILAAYYAKQMGLPVHRLICASNKNKVLTDFINTGFYDRRRQLYRTISPSMDILVSSNLERLLFELVDRDPAAVKGFMSQLQEKGCYQLGAQACARLQEEFWGGYAGEEETIATIGDVYQKYGYLLDPHTAVGVKVCRDYRRETGDHRPVIIAATASPFKFTRSVVQAVMGEENYRDKDDFALLEVLSGFTGEEIPAALRGIQEKPVRHRLKTSPEGMKEATRQVLGLS
jgi:threonine synthase